MIQIQYPSALISAAADMGVELAPGFSFDAEEPLLLFNDQLIDIEAADFQGEASDFGINDFSVIQPKWHDAQSFEVDDFEIIGGQTNVHGEAEFGLSLGNLKSAVKKATANVAASAKLRAASRQSTQQLAARASTKLPAPLAGIVKASSALTAAARVAAAPKAAAVSFTVPKGVSVQTAMAAADKLLGDPKIKNPAQVINNTKAMAALGVPNAARAVSVLSAVEQIRAAAKAPIGKAVISVAKPVNTAVMTAVITPEIAKRIAELAVKAKAAKPAPTPVKKVAAAVAKPVNAVVVKAAAAVKPKTSTVSVETQKSAGFWFKVRKFFGLEG